MRFDSTGRRLIVDGQGQRVFIYDDATDDVLANPYLSGTPTQFAIPVGLLLPGVSYVFSVTQSDEESFGLENRSVAFTQTPYVIPEPGTTLLLGLGLAVLGRRRRSPAHRP